MSKIINFLENTYYHEFSLAEWIITILSAGGAVLLMCGVFKICISIIQLIAM